MRAGDTSPSHKLLEILLTFVLKDDILYIVVNEVQQQLHISFLVEHCGELSEWLKEHAWKACVRETVPRVRISHSPPLFYRESFFGRTTALWSCAMGPHEPRQVRKEAAVSESFHVPQGSLGAVARRRKGNWWQP